MKTLKTVYNDTIIALEDIKAGDFVEVISGMAVVTHDTATFAAIATKNISKGADVRDDCVAEGEITVPKGSALANYLNSR